MNVLNVAALLEKNPQVDRDKLLENNKKIEEARKMAGKKPERPVVTPYGGRRLVRDDEGRTLPHASGRNKSN